MTIGEKEQQEQEEELHNAIVQTITTNVERKRKYRVGERHKWKGPEEKGNKFQEVTGELTWEIMRGLHTSKHANDMDIGRLHYLSCGLVIMEKNQSTLLAVSGLKECPGIIDYDLYVTTADSL